MASICLSTSARDHGEPVLDLPARPGTNPFGHTTVMRPSGWSAGRHVAPMGEDAA